MKNKKQLFLSLSLTLSIISFPGSVFSQYGTGESGLGRFLAENPDIKAVDEKHVNVPYERGKAVYKGRGDNIPKLEYCILHKGEKVKLKRSSMRSYKQGTYTQLSENLYNCENKEQKIITQLPRKAFINMLYFLDVEYKLDLQRK